MKMKPFYYLCALAIIFLSNDLGIAKNTELKTFAQETAPKWMMQNQNGQPVIRGMCADILMAIERKSNHLRFSWRNEFYPVKRMVSFLEEGDEIQLIVSVAHNSTRAKKFIYSKPLYEVHHVVAVRKNDPVQISSFNDIANLGKQGVILTVFGTATSAFIKNRPENLIIYEKPTPEANLSLLSKNRGRFFYYYDLGIYYTIMRDEFKNKIKVLPISFRKYEHYIIYSKKVPQPIINEIDIIIDDMKKSGEMDKIQNKYRPGRQ